LDKIGFHTLRHTFASHKLQGINYKGERIKPLRIEIIAEILGHRSIDLTKKVYAKYDKKALIEIL
jgi:integrase